FASDPDKGHVLANLRIAAGLEEGEFVGTHWQDAWLYKWLEAASAVHGVTPDPALDRLMDEAVELIGRAQQPDGYIATQTIVRGWDRFQMPQHHELYTMGHLITAACIHHRITGKTSFLEVARRVADHACGIFEGKSPQMAHFPSNPSIIMGAVELYRTTRDHRYLDLANNIIDMRGAFDGGQGDDIQDRVPLREEQSVVGHAVRYTYLYAGAADVVLETGDPALLDALERLWRDLTETKMYITGGCCALHHGLSAREGRRGDFVHEAAGAPYELPSATAYNETCAQVGVFLWGWRMLALTGDARYADVMEREMYNGFLPGIGLAGTDFFYTNPLRWHGHDQILLSSDTLQRHQPGGESRICCPTNVLRSIAEMHGYFYGLSDAGLWVHQYGGSVFDAGEIRLEQDTCYPWDGAIRLRVDRAPDRGLTIRLRIPEWAQGASAELNGRPVDAEVQPGSYLAIDRPWAEGDEILLDLPMGVRMMEAHPRSEELRNQVAIMRGPLVYCLESIDLPDGVKVEEVVVPRDADLTPRHDPDLLGGVTALEGQARRRRAGDWSGQLYREAAPLEPETIRIKLIPYYAWNNRGVPEMTVWLPVA
ncbi:MAG: glycoside hydrolase family 127 protein, partial [Candidatus Latescibacteria bacterium]|nr:glycoside hydrolase family 127 protein [Candidatus Latescibacterota bacterium]